MGGFRRLQIWLKNGWEHEILKTKEKIGKRGPENFSQWTEDIKILEKLRDFD